jgi:tol-pal system protein YbgF
MAMKKYLISAALILASSPLVSMAELAPVVDYSEAVTEVQDGGVSLSEPSHRDSQPLSLSERLQRVESKVDHLTESNVKSRVEELQQTIQELRGDVERLSHELEQVSVRLKQSQEIQAAKSAKVERPPESASVKQKPAIAEAVTAPQNEEASQDQSTPVNPRPKTVPAMVRKSETKAPNPSATPAPKVKPVAATTATAAPASATASAPATGEQGDYQQGFSLLKSKQYDRALSQFKDYINKYPQGRYAVNAHFWMGEISYLQGKYAVAKKSFEVVVKNHPKDTKVPDALLKLAIIATDTGHKQQAEEMLAQIQKKYPGTTPARLAMIRAQELRLSMH